MAYRSGSSITGSNDSVTVPLPAGTQDGDWLVYIIGNEQQAITSWGGFTPDATASFTTDGGDSRVGGAIVGLRLASSEPANRTITIGGGDAAPVRAACIALSGRSSSVPSLAAVTNDAGGGTGTVSTPLTGVTATAGDDIIVCSAVIANNTSGTWVFTPPASYTSQQSATTAALFYAGGVNLSTRENVSAGATGTLTGSWALASTTGETCGLVIAFPASGGGGGAPDKSYFFMFGVSK